MKLVKVNSEYYLLGGYAKRGEYALTITGKCMKVDDNVRLWRNGCNSVIASNIKIDKLPILDKSQIEELLGHIDIDKFTLKDMEKCFSKGISFGIATINGADNEPYKFLSFIQSITKEKTEWDIECEMEPSGYVVSGGLKPSNKIGGKGLETHWNHKPKINEQGYITITSIK